MIVAKKYVITITFLMFLTVCGIIFLAKFTSEHVESMVTKEFTSHMLEIAKASVISINNYINSTKIIINIARDELLEHDFYSDNEEFKYDFINFHTNFEEISIFDIRYIDSEGKSKYSIKSSEIIGDDLSNSSIFKTIKDKADPEYIDIRLVSLTGEKKGDLGIKFSLGFFQKSDTGNKKEFKGIVTAVTTLDGFIEKYIKNMNLVGYSGYAWLLDSKGMILYHPNIYTGKTYKDIMSSALYSDSFKESIKKITAHDYMTSVYSEGGIDYVFASCKVTVGIHDWYVVISEPEEKTHATLKSYASINFLLTSTALFAVILFGSFLLLIFYVRNKKLLETVDIQIYQLEYARKINRELDMIIHTIAHDLKSPLTSVMGFSDQLINKATEHGLVKDDHQYLSKISSNANYMKILIDSLLEFARIGEISSNIEITSLREVIKEVKAQLHYFIEERSAIINMPKELPVIHADRMKITQVFLNLISNALKFVPESRTPIVDIDFSEDDEYYNILISDNGIGIKEQEIDDIFKIFHRVEEIEVSGTGVGLAIVKKILDDHQGKISVHNNQDKEGTTFTVSLKK